MCKCVRGWRTQGSLATQANQTVSTGFLRDHTSKMNMVDELTSPPTCIHTHAHVYTPSVYPTPYAHPIQTQRDLLLKGVFSCLFKKGTATHHEVSLRKQNTFFQFVSKSRRGPQQWTLISLGCLRRGWGLGRWLSG